MIKVSTEIIRFHSDNQISLAGKKLFAWRVVENNCISSLNGDNNQVFLTEEKLLCAVIMGYE